ncbi:Uncharacterized protein OS=Cyanothece sp. (strain PCC 7425 / ATCC 29141) GN=Cyan7425_0947 PE=4 SV=1: DUF421 [Gemmata massiliana]|uniref:YetF C-terminal domain-containing protein n=1 Tax=Gemmata massiliana TaxID=1210884 RepID=A0A6P2DGJ9_9BACT|nr:YetF domain-containing protein [Gemmata massiliana]VTS00674.1 Uncharacterized protein OS=Cyanothece sp. (strain PCC 7425 / ATCC 29141) GN=Cyan7425_0947 PE=4 SV=1: DUF421 [Gemmata massiliana]
MSAFQAPNWEQVFVPDASLLESFLRGTVVYLSVLLLFRVVLKRQGGSIGLPDIMLVVLVSECVSAPLGAEAKSIPNGLAAVLALLVWSYSIDRLCYRWPWLRRRLEPEPVPVVADGKALEKNMSAEGLTDDELRAQLRENGVDDVREVRSAFIESDGSVSVVPKGDGPAPAAPRETVELGPPPDVEFLLSKFRAAADELRAALAWHESQAENHRKAAKAVRGLLGRHGVGAAHRAAPTVREKTEKGSHDP